MATLLEKDGEITAPGGLCLLRQADAPDLFSIWTPEGEILGSGPTVAAAIGDARRTLRAQKEAQRAAAACAAEAQALVAKITSGVQRLAVLGQQISYDPRGTGGVMEDLRRIERQVQELNQRHFSM